VLLLGGAVVHVLAPESPTAVALKPPLVGAAAGITRSARVSVRSGTAATRAIPAARFPRGRNDVRPGSPPPAAHYNRVAVLRSAPMRSHAATRSARPRRPAPLAGHVLHVAATRAGLPHALKPRARRQDEGSPPVARVPFTAHAAGRIGRIARTSRRPQPAPQLRAPTPPLGYDVRPVLARVSISALPALPIATTPVRGKVPSARSAVVLGPP